MAQMVDIEVDLSGDSDGLDEDESEEDGLSSEEEGGSDEHMQGGMAGEEVSTGGAAGVAAGAGTQTRACWEAGLKEGCMSRRARSVLERVARGCRQATWPFSACCLLAIVSSCVALCVLFSPLCCVCCSRLVRRLLVAAARVPAWTRTPA
jgi:hypothetical protein